MNTMRSQHELRFVASTERCFLLLATALLIFQFGNAIPAMGQSSDSSGRGAKSSDFISTSDAEFSGVKAPDWVLDGVAKVFLSLEDLDGINEAGQIGATILHAGGPSPYYPLRAVDPDSGVPSDQRETIIRGIATAKKHSMRVVLGISPYAPTHFLRAHPDWIYSGEDNVSTRSFAGVDFDSPDNIHLRALPLNTPYGDYLIECLAEIVRDFEIDGVSFDGCYHPTINYSPFEKELFQKETGRVFPKRIDLLDENYRYYLLWADEKLENWYRKLGERIKEVNSQAAIYTWTTNAGRYGHFLTSPRVMSARMNRLIDCPVQEWWMDEVNLGSTVVPYFGAAYVRAVSGGRVGACEPYLMSHGNPYSADSFPPHELKVRCLGAMTNGAFTPLAQMAGKAATQETLIEIVRRKELFTRLQAAPWGALLVSESTRQFYAHGNIMERWLSHALGMYRVGMEEHLPIQIITEQDLSPERLRQFKVLLLPNVAALSDLHVQTIQEYVRAGGGVVATCETSLFDELGNPRIDFALRDLFGTSFKGRVSESNLKRELDANFRIVIDDQYWVQRGNVGALRFSDYSNSIFFQNKQLRTLLPSGQATFRGAILRPGPFDPDRTPGALYFPEGSRDAFPIFAYGEFGKGRVVYSAAGLDSAYYSYPFPYQRVVMSQAIRWVAREPFSIQVKAPMCVQSTFWKKENKWIVHLWNGMNTTSDHGSQDAEVPLREESIPVHGMELSIRGIVIHRATCEPEGVEIEIRKRGEETMLSIPPLEIHSAIVLEGIEDPDVH